ncbi:MAG: DUF4092 domain-containing protein [Muribaculaceae bacterium]|nr:DUF4092 domain-containing protein [Muribaculaceae bacterium]
MKGGRLFLIVCLCFFVLTAIVKINAPVKYDWDDQFSYRSTQPLGCALFDSVMKASLPGRYSVTPRTLAECASKDTCRMTYLLMQSSIVGDSLFLANVVEMLERGDNVVIATTLIYSDEFGRRVGVYVNGNEVSSWNVSRESSSVKWCKSGEKYRVKNMFIKNELEIYDEAFTPLMSRDSLEYYGSGGRYYDYIPDTDSTLVIPDKIEMKDGTFAMAAIRNLGKGKLMIVSSPYFFTNYAMRYESMRYLSMRLLSQVKDLPIVRIDETMPDEGEITPELHDSKFRVMLSYPSLKWALYLAVFTVLLSMFFTARRRQRIIPVIKAPENQNIAMVRHIGSLYYSRRDHLDLLTKKYQYFAEELRRRVMVDINDDDHFDAEVELLAMHTGMKKGELVDSIMRVRTIINMNEEVTTQQLHETIDAMNAILASL